MSHTVQYQDSLAKKERAREAEKKDICDFVKRLDADTVNKLNEIKQKNYSHNELKSSSSKRDEMQYEILLKQKDIKDINEKISYFFISSDTKKELNNKRDGLTATLTSLTSNLEKFKNICKVNVFVDKLRINYNNYKYNNNLDESSFYSYLLDCDVITYATTTNYVEENNRMKNKYLKYKQKYLSLKNKIN